MEYERLSLSEQLNTHADFSKHILEQESTRFDTARDNIKSTHRSSTHRSTHRSSIIPVSQREEFKEFVQTYDHVPKCGVPMCTLDNCTHRTHPIDGYDENDDIVDVNPTFETHV